MPQLLALEWDGREARLAVARGFGRSITVEQAFSVDLGPRNAGDTFSDVSVGERVASALSARGVDAVETLVAVGRASIELRVLTVPPAPPEEMPEIVRFQAMRQFTALGEDWPLDFVVLNESEEGTNVLAAAISPELVKQIQDTCAAAGLSPQRLVLRPFAAASLLRRHSTDDRCRLMVDLLADEADLTVLIDQRVVFMRTVRLSHADDVELGSAALVGEIRRTIVAAQNQLGGRRVEQVVICGDENNHGLLRTKIAEQLSLEVEMLDVFSNVQLGTELRRNPPDHPGRFAPLLGMLSDEASGTEHTIDFLHPRQKPELPSQIQRNGLIAGGVAAAALAIVAIIWINLAMLDSRIRSLAKENTESKNKAETARQTTDRAEDIDLWREGDVNWLDEIRELSNEFPPSEKAMIVQLSAGALTSGGRMTLNGVATDSATITDIKVKLGDENHEVKGRGARPTDLVHDRYNRLFTESVTVELADDPPAEPSPASKPQASTPPAKRSSKP